MQSANRCYIAAELMTCLGGLRDLSGFLCSSPATSWRLLFKSNGATRHQKGSWQYIVVLEPYGLLMLWPELAAGLQNGIPVSSSHAVYHNGLHLSWVSRPSLCVRVTKSSGLDVV